jgi:hypothetical protein
LQYGLGGHFGGNNFPYCWSLPSKAHPESN